MKSSKRIYTTDTLPYTQNLSSFAVPYTPEKFTRGEKKFLTPFFSNIDKPLYAVKGLPEEVKGALASRYSRSTKSLRRMFLTEYIEPILRPETQKDWNGMSPKEKREAEKLRNSLNEYMDFVHKNGGLEKVVNVQRGRAFFEKWLAQYGDDSIAELGGELVCIEGLSNVATKEIQDKRVGLSPLEKSSRYVQFWETRPDGEYQYIVPGEIKGSKYEKEYRAVMDQLFDTYSQIAEPYTDYIKKLYPRGTDETERSFHNSRSAKRFDDIRDLLPFSTQTNVAMYGNGRAFEDLISRLLYHPLGEMRYWGQELLLELEKVVPSFVARPKTERGAQTQYYRHNIISLRQDLAKEILGENQKSPKPIRWVKLVDYTKDADVTVLSSFLFSAENDTYQNIEKKVKAMSGKKRAEYIARILDERKFGKSEVKREGDRFRKVPRAFENAYYLYDCFARGGDYRDLHRHRQLTQERQRFTTAWGYDLEKEVLKSDFAGDIKKVLEKADALFQKLEKLSPDVGQYCVPFGYIQHWYMHMTAREVYWMVELRTGPQGRPHYRQICQQMAIEAKKSSPALFQGIMTDMNDYSLSRRESEKKIDRKLTQLEKKK